MKTKLLRQEYAARVNRVIDHIEDNIDRELTLEYLAGIANFSPFHFHRIFRAMTGETLNRFINRIRIEKAASRLIDNPKATITEIALDCGFSGSATFARAFKDAFHMSASEWRLNVNPRNRKIVQTNSKNNQTVGKAGKDFSIVSSYSEDRTYNPLWRINMQGEKTIQVEVKDMPELHVAYVRHLGPYQGDSELFGRLIEKLLKWAGPRGLIRFPETKLLFVYHDDPKLTDDEKLRTSICLTVPQNTSVDGEIGEMNISGGKYAVARFEINSDQFEESWDMIYGGWLPESGYQPDDRLSYEICLNDPEEHPEKKHIIDICVPVKPL